MKVSVIIPVYNAEQTIGRCLDSLMSQTLKEIEVIAVNDASQDGSLEILKMYEQKYPERIIVIDSKKNRGAGGARNLGLEKATGEFIGFVDADDFVDDIMYERLYQKMQEDEYDYVDCGFYNMNKNEAILKVTDELCGNITKEQRKILIVKGGFIWSKLFRKSFLDGIGVRFREKAKMEDADFLIIANAHAHKVGNVKEVLYLYNKVQEESKWSLNQARLDQCDHVIQLMKSVYSNTKNIASRDEWWDGVEAVLIYLYSLGINCCMANKNLTVRELKKLKELKLLKQSIVKGNYENEFVVNTHTLDEIKLMKHIDHTKFNW